MKSVVVVVGMHRSGTSLTASILQALGVELGSRLIEADLNNRGGYFEQPDIVRLNRQLLDHLNRRWVRPQGMLPYPTSWWKEPQVQEVKRQLKSLVRREISNADGMWGFKDPRVSRLIPLWRDIFAELDADPRYILAVRDPRAVAASVLRRDGLSPAQTQLLWLQHNLEAVQDAGDSLAKVVMYRRWFDQPERQATELARAINLEAAAERPGVLERVEHLIDPSLNHHQANRQTVLPPALDTYDLLYSASESGEMPSRIHRQGSQLRESMELLTAWQEALEMRNSAEPGVHATSSRPAQSIAESIRSLARQLTG